MGIPIRTQVLTGFLGSGKTTLLNQLLRHDAFKNAAVIINEFGEVGLDHLLVEAADDTIIELSNGCLCCTVRGQLVETLEILAQRNPDRILIETTGLADPIPVLQAIIGTPSLQGRLQFAGLLCVFDAQQGAEIINQHAEAQKQLALADWVIVSKLDREPNRDKAKADIAIWSSAPVMSKDTFLETPELILDVGVSMPTLPEDSHLYRHHHNINRHSKNISSVTLRNNKPLSRQTLDMFLDLLLSAHGEKVLRLKGLVHIKDQDQTGPLLIQSVGRILEDEVFLEQWPDQDHSTRIVVFLDGIEPGFVQRLFDGFIGQPSIDTADAAALYSNPLAIPGYKG